MTNEPDRQTASLTPEPEARPIRDTTRNLIESIWLDAWPRNAAIVDFGLDSQAHYEAIYYGVREGEITPEALDAALGKGDQLTALTRSSPSNPHRDIVFRTSWDEMSLSTMLAGKGKGSLASPSEIAERQRNKPAQPDRANERDTDHGRD
jgi:hypothetical protein